MQATAGASGFQAVIESVERLSPDEQSMLVEILHSRMIEQRRAELVTDVAEAREAYRLDAVRRGTASDVMAELED